MQNNRFESPLYPFPPVGSVDALARMLQCPVKELLRVGRISDGLYNTIMQPKKDGTMRVCYDAKSPLKGMQGRIKCMILRQVKYPSYLMGGLADPENPRDYVRNAAQHAGARVVISEDVAQFFPSTTAAVVFDIWRQFFKFPEEIARLLTRLTTRRDQLPQGAKTSSYLANLAFWAHEPRLVERLRSMGYGYTRYVDDVTISSRTDREGSELGEAFTLFAAMISRYGLRMKRSKHRIAYAGQQMEATGLLINEHGAGLKQQKRSAIRTVVFHCELEAKNNPQSDQLQRMKRRALSMVGQCARLHPTESQALKERLDTIILPMTR